MVTLATGHRALRTWTARAYTKLTGGLTLQGELESYPGQPDVGFLVRTNIPHGPSPIAQAHARFIGTLFSSQLLLKEYLQ